MKKSALLLALCLIAVPAMAIDAYHPAVGPPHQGGTPRDACWMDAPDLNGLIVSSEQILMYGLESEIANDFVACSDLNHITVWTGYWNNSAPCAPGIPFPGLNIRIYEDAGCVPGHMLYDMSPTVTETLYGCQVGFYPLFQDDMDVSCSLVLCNLYWLGAQVKDHVFPPQAGRLAAPSIQGCVSAFKSAYFGYPDWTPWGDDGWEYDASQALFGTPCHPTPTQPSTWGQIKEIYR